MISKEHYLQNCIACEWAQQNSPLPSSLFPKLDPCRVSLAFIPCQMSPKKYLVLIVGQKTFSLPCFFSPKSPYFTLFLSSVLNPNLNYFSVELWSLFPFTLINCQCCSHCREYPMNYQLYINSSYKTYDWNCTPTFSVFCRPLYKKPYKMPRPYKEKNRIEYLAPQYSPQKLSKCVFKLNKQTNKVTDISLGGGFHSWVKLHSAPYYGSPSYLSFRLCGTGRVTQQGKQQAARGLASCHCNTQPTKRTLKGILGISDEEVCYPSLAGSRV